MGTAVLLAVTRHGAYLSPDALAYVGTARSLVDDQGFSPPPGAPPIGNFPPLYAMLLAGVGALGPDPLTVARYVGPIAFGATILVVGILVWRLAGSLPLAVASQLLVLAGADFLAYHSAALSEPLFLLLAVLVVATLSACIQARRRPLLLVAAALLAGTATLARYVGLALVAGGAAALLLAAGKPRPWKEAVAFVTIALAPLFAWLAWLSGVEGPTGTRTVAFHAPGLGYVTTGLRSASTWLIPLDVPWPWRGLLAAPVAAAVGAFVWRNQAKWYDRRVGGLIGVLALAYLGALVVDRFLFDVTGRLDSRFLLPVHLAAIGLAAWALHGVDLRKSHLARVGLCAVVGLQVATGISWVADALTDRDVRPGGFGAPAWVTSEVIDQARALPATAPLYTNSADALWFHARRQASPVPEKRIFLTGEVNPAYEVELGAMLADLGRGGLLVYFTRSPARRVFLPTTDELTERHGLQVVNRDAVAVALRSSPPGRSR